METNEENMAHVAELIKRAKDAGLRGTVWLESLGVERCCEGYNGIGPEFLGEDLRAKSTAWFRIFEPAALIHDGRNHVSDGSTYGFDGANIEFLCNCRILADRAYSWWNWKRYRARMIADALYDFVSSPAGWHAWLEAHAKTNRKELP